jgi:hypothetical protein
MGSFNVNYKAFYDWFDAQYGIGQIQSAINDIRNRKWTPKYLLSRVRELVNIMAVVVAAMENFSRDIKSLDNDEKLDIVAQFMDDNVSLPFYLEVLDYSLFKIIISWAVSQAKTLFKWGDPITAEVVKKHIDTVNA